MPVLTDGELLDLLASAVGFDRYWIEDFAEGLFKRIADLVDRPTCGNVHDGREFECSECGMQWHLLNRADPLEEWAHVRRPRHCPNCGAKVIG